MQCNSEELLANGELKGNGDYINGNDSSSTSTQINVNSFSPVDREILRLIAQYLQTLGMKETLEHLVSESGCKFEHPAAAQFRTFVMDGNWSKALHSILELRELVSNQEIISKMKFLLYEQKYLELVEDGATSDALNVLKYELTPMQFNTDRVHSLASLLMYAKVNDFRKAAKWPGKGLLSRSKLMDQLQSLLSPSVMLPPRRLVYLLEQALKFQVNTCTYHNSSIPVAIGSMSFLTDHFCSKENLPCKVVETLREHTDEVWYCKFNHSGDILATGSKDGRLNLYSVTKDCSLKYVRSFDGHDSGVSYIAWSPDDKYFLVCGPDECPSIWVWEYHTSSLKVKFSHNNEDSLSAASWYPDSKRFVCGGNRGQFYTVDLDGSVIDSREGIRVMCLANVNDNQTVLAADTHRRLRAYTSSDDYPLIQEDNPIMSFTLSPCKRYALLNIATQGVHLWDLDNKFLVRKFRGVTQGYYTIYSSIGGANNDFVASGSEDSKVYMWHINKDMPIAELVGHNRTVNCIAWNPKYPSMLVSVSDDNTIKVWGPSVELNDGNDIFTSSEPWL